MARKDGFGHYDKDAHARKPVAPPSRADAALNGLVADGEARSGFGVEFLDDGFGAGFAVVGVPQFGEDGECFLGLASARGAVDAYDNVWVFWIDEAYSAMAPEGFGRLVGRPGHLEAREGRTEVVRSVVKGNGERVGSKGSELKCKWGKIEVLCALGQRVSAR